MAKLIQDQIGHSKQIDFLKKFFTSDRSSGAIILCGTDGIGKKRSALAVIQEVMCGDLSCDSCRSCKAIEQPESEFHLFLGEDESHSIKVDSVRRVHQFLVMQKLTDYRFIIVNNAEKMTPQAANAILKNIEEPPPGTFFVLITSQENSILPTIRSRCQLLRYGVLSSEEVEKLGVDSDWIIQLTRGQMALARSIDTEKGTKLRADTAQWLKDTLDERRDPKFSVDKPSYPLFLFFLGSFVRDAFVKKQGVETQLLNQDQQGLVDSLTVMSEEKLLSISEELNRYLSYIDQNVDRNLITENLGYAFS